MMVGVPAYGYSTEVFPSRGIAGRSEGDLAFRVLGTGNLPNRRTLCGFRRRYLEDLQGAARGGGACGARDAARFGKLSAGGARCGRQTGRAGVSRCNPRPAALAVDPFMAVGAIRKPSGRHWSRWSRPTNSCSTGAAASRRSPRAAAHIPRSGAEVGPSLSGPRCGWGDGTPRYPAVQAVSTEKATMLRSSRLNSTPIRWTGRPRFRYLSA